MSLLNDFLSRTHKNAKIERDAITEAFKILDGVREQTVAIRADGRWSKTGQAAKLAEVITQPWADLGKLREKVAATRADIEKSRAKMVPPKLDAGDLVGALERVELRTMLREAPRADRLRLARDHDAFAVAALTALPVLSGFGTEPEVPGQPSDLDIVRTAYQQRNFLELHAGIELREEAAAAVDNAIRHVSQQIATEAGVTESEIARLMVKADKTEVDPQNLPRLTRAELRAMQPWDANAAMKRVFNGEAQLVDEAA
jgi:hypothetical protein